MAEQDILTLTYERDTKRTHRYNVVSDRGLFTGSLYLSKEVKRAPHKMRFEVKWDENTTVNGNNVVRRVSNNG